jgi:hypothetical protein
MEAELKEKFLNVLIKTGGNIARTCKKMSLCPSTVLRHRRNDEAFGIAVSEAIDTGADLLEDEAIRRALDGVDKPVFYKGKEVSVIREYSDSLLMFLLKGKRKEKYGDSKHVKLEGGDNPLKMEHGITPEIKSVLDEIYNS